MNTTQHARTCKPRWPRISTNSAACALGKQRLVEETNGCVRGPKSSSKLAAENIVLEFCIERVSEGLLVCSSEDGFGDVIAQVREIDKGAGSQTG